jgi:hypothetical protein
VVGKELESVHVGVTLQAMCFGSLVIVEVDVLLLSRGKELVAVQNPVERGEEGRVIERENSRPANE